MRKILIALALVLSTVLPSAYPASVEAASCTNKPAQTKTKRWQADDELNGFRFQSVINYSHCGSYDILKSFTIRWNAASYGKAWTCSNAGGYRNIRMNPDSFAGHDYKETSWTCSANGGAKTYNFTDVRYNHSSGSAQRCLGVKITLDKNNFFDNHPKLATNCAI